MRVAWFSTISRPAVLRSSYITHELMRLNVAWDVEIFSTDQDIADSASVLKSSKQVFHFHRFWQRMREKPFDLCVYNLEDVAELRFVERAMCLWPGICIYHDTSFANLQMAQFSHSTAGSDIDEFLKRTCGDDAPPLGTWKIRQWNIDSFLRLMEMSADIWKLPMHSILPSLSALSLLEVEAGKSTVLSLPLSGFQAAKGHSVENIKGKVIGFCGTKLLDERIASKLESLNDVMMKDPDVRVRWIVSSSQELNIARGLLQRKLSRHIDKVEFFVADKIDDLINVLAGCAIWLGTSASPSHGVKVVTLAALSLQKLVIGSDSSEWDEVDAENFFPISLGRNEVVEMTCLLNYLLNNVDVNKKVKTESVETSEKYFARLGEVFEKVLPSSREIFKGKLKDYQTVSADLQELTKGSLSSSFSEASSKRVGKLFQGQFE